MRRCLQAARLDKPWGEEAQRLLREEFRHSMTVLVCDEDLPETATGSTSTNHRESDGLPGVKLEYRVSEPTRRALDFGLARAEEMLRAAGHSIERCGSICAPLTGGHLLARRGWERSGPLGHRRQREVHGSPISSSPTAAFFRRSARSIRARRSAPWRSSSPMIFREARNDESLPPGDRRHHPAGRTPGPARLPCRRARRQGSFCARRITDMKPLFG